MDVDNKNNKEKDKVETVALEDKLKKIRDGVVGCKATFDGPFGVKPVIYADWTASARAYEPIEKYIHEDVLPYYANTHTFTSVTGLQSTWFRAEARQIIQQAVNGNTKKDVVMFTGSGITAGVNKMVHILGLSVPLPVDAPADTRPVVFVGPYEHHSNLLPWRESSADVVIVAEDESGQIDLKNLKHLLIKYQHRPLRVGSFSAASNVTGILTNIDAVTALLHRHGALSFWDYASAAPYVSIDMNPVLDGDHPDRAYVHKDAVFISPHKFVGGVNTPGVMIAKKRLFENPRPAEVGGGTVFFVTEDSHRYLSKRNEREEGGTPDIVGAIRAGLTFQLKQDIGAEHIEHMESNLWGRIARELGKNPKIALLGPPPDASVKRLPIASFLIRHKDGKFLHYNFVSTLLNDLYGIQSRGGCMCAGPYSQRLLGMSDKSVQDMQVELVKDPKNSEFLRPGYTRISFTYFMCTMEVSFILKAIQDIAEHGWKLLPCYRFNQTTGEWKHKSRLTKDPERRWLDHAWLTGPRKYKYKQEAVKFSSEEYDEAFFENLLKEGKKAMISGLTKKEKLGDQTKLLTEEAKLLRWFVLPSEVLFENFEIQHTAEKEKSVETSTALPQENGILKPLPVFDPKRYWKSLEENATQEFRPVLEETDAEVVVRKRKKEEETKKENEELCVDGSCFRIRKKDKYPLRDASVIRSQTDSALSSETTINGKEDVGISPKLKKVKTDLEENLLGKKEMEKAKLRPKIPKNMLRHVGKAIAAWNMIENGDRLLLGLSGGKDSLALLHILLTLQKRAPIRFEIAACTIDPMTEAFDPSPLIPYMESLGVKYHFIKTPIFDNAKAGALDGTSICSYCARMKRGALYSCARKNGYTKLVLAQHLDDNAETMLMSLFHNGQLRSMKASYTEKKGDVTVIRPLCYVREHDLKQFSYSAKLPVINDNCPACFQAPQERRRMKKLLSKEEAFAPHIFNNIRRGLIPLLDEEILLKLNDFTNEKLQKRVKKYTSKAPKVDSQR